MTKTLSINKVSIQTVIMSAKSGDEIVLEENGKPIAKITTIAEIEQTKPKQRAAGLVKGKKNGYFVADDQINIWFRAIIGKSFTCLVSRKSTASPQRPV